MSALDFLGVIWDLVRAAWDWIKKLILPIIGFFQNIVAFFKERSRLEKLRRDKRIIATAIKENLANGNVRVVNCLFDTENEDLVDESVDAQIMSAESMDTETRNNFADKDMIILK